MLKPRSQSPAPETIQYIKDHELRSSGAELAVTGTGFQCVGLNQRHKGGRVERLCTAKVIRFDLCNPSNVERSNRGKCCG